MLIKLIMFASKSPGLRSILLEPTFSMLASIIIPDFEMLLEELGIPFTVKKSPFPQYFLYFESGIHEVRLYSATNETKIVGFKCAAAFVDEFEIIKPELAWTIYRKLVARLRQGDGFKFISFFTTPDQFGFCHDFFVEQPDDYKKLYRGKTTENWFLPDDYITGLYEAYPPNLVDAFLNGEWVNLNNNRVYPDFDRNLNGTDREIQLNDRLYVGIDFNNNIMAATTFVIVNGNPYAVDEFHGAVNTQALIQDIKQRYPKYHVTVYPDSSGTQERSSAESSDISQLKLAMGTRNVIFPAKNPLIATRLNACNTMILNAHGVRRFKVNVKKCPHLVKGLEQQPMKNGQPDKAHPEDDHCDSFGYLIVNKFAIKRPSLRQFG